ncbi:MAG: YceH family protein [Gallionella sp.]
MTSLPIFTLLETRVLGVLIEKEKTVPDSYPLSLNNLVLGCNQKTARDPVLNVTEQEVHLALDTLRTHSLIVESSGGRVMRYAHNARRVFKLPEQSVALIAILMLRGPQTAGELRSNCDRLYKFGDISSVEAFLDELAEAASPWVVKLPKLPGSREHRWAHLLSGEVEMVQLHDEPAYVSPPNLDASEVIALSAHVIKLQSEVVALREIVEKMQKELGM